MQQLELTQCYHAHKNKFSWKPDYFFLIPDLVIDSHFKLKASCGFDAIAQGIESILSLKSNSKSFDYSKKSLNYSFSNFSEFLKNPNSENTYTMCLAANLSGKAISISRTTAPHALSYPFTSFFNISHGHAVSLTLNEFILLSVKLDTSSFSNGGFSLFR